MLSWFISIMIPVRITLLSSEETAFWTLEIRYLSTPISIFNVSCSFTCGNWGYSSRANVLSLKTELRHVSLSSFVSFNNSSPTFDSGKLFKTFTIILVGTTTLPGVSVFTFMLLLTFVSRSVP